MVNVPLIDASELKLHIEDKNWAVVDCRFSLDDADRGRRDYLEAHIPGAIYAHLNNDLSGDVIPGKTGRHPLPAIASLAETFSAWGIDASTQVVAYDNSTGGMAAARLWWMLGWMGHERAAVLDGGWKAWVQAGLPARSGRETRQARQFKPRENPAAYVTADQVLALIHDTRYVILDARSGPRYRGESESIDPVAGHIPGAISAPYEENLTSDGRFLPPETLRNRLEKFTKSVPPENVICYCGSGVTAAHNILAMAYSGLGRPRLYAGSWSDWITDHGRPVATGSE